MKPDDPALGDGVHKPTPVVDPSTYFGQANAAIAEDAALGRYATVDRPSIVGAAKSPLVAPNWSREAAMIPNEPPLSIDINTLPALGGMGDFDFRQRVEADAKLNTWASVVAAIFAALGLSEKPTKPNSDPISIIPGPCDANCLCAQLVKGWAGFFERRERYHTLCTRQEVAEASENIPLMLECISKKFPDPWFAARPKCS